MTPLMYADDLALVAGSIGEVREAIALIRKWSNESNMLLNEQKSAVMRFGRRTTRPPTEDVDGIPFRTSYVYLGGAIQSNQKLRAHMLKIGSKIGWVTARLTPFRCLGDLRLSINLFKLFLAPLLYQAAGAFLRADPVAREAY